MQSELTASGGRRLTYLRLSVTDLCNLRCRYCMPPEGVPKLKHAEILTYEELRRLVQVGSTLGLRKIRFTGGEPLVRKGLINFIRELHQAGICTDMRLTTNGVLLPTMARDLAGSGITGLNISLDAIDPVIYAEMVGLPGPKGQEMARRAWEGFYAALDLGFNTKINCVPIRGVNDSQLVNLASLVLEHPVDVRFIEHMPIGSEGLWSQERFLSAGEIMTLLTQRLGPLEPLPVDDPSAPARRYAPKKAQGAIGFISPISGHFCSDCNRLRLTADGKLKPCLLTNREINLREPLRSGASDDELRELFLLSASYKPANHLEAGTGELDSPGGRREMFRIGG